MEALPQCVGGFNLSCFYAWTLQNWQFCSCFSAPELDFAVFLHVFCASIGLDLRFTRKFTWNRVALMARNRDFAAFYMFSALRLA